MSKKRFDSEKAALNARLDDLTEVVIFVKAVHSYLTAMEEKSPADNHPTHEWLLSGFSKLSLHLLSLAALMLSKATHLQGIRVRRQV